MGCYSFSPAFQATSPTPESAPDDTRMTIQMCIEIARAKGKKLALLQVSLGSTAGEVPHTDNVFN